MKKLGCLIRAKDIIELSSVIATEVDAKKLHRGRLEDKQKVITFFLRSDLSNLFSYRYA